MDFFTYFAVMVASWVLSSVFTKTQTANKPVAATEEDWNMPVPDEGTPQCVFFGDCWTSDWFVLAYGNYRYRAIRK